jgi:hypothetical protein
MNRSIEEFRELIFSAEQRLRKIGEEESSIKPARNKWSSKQILGHLIDSCVNNMARFINGQFQNDFIFPGYDQNKWVEAQNYEKADWNYLIDLWMINNIQLLRLIKSIPDFALNRLHLIHNFDLIAFNELSKIESATLLYLIEDYYGHMQYHLDRIFKMSSTESTEDQI